MTENAPRYEIQLCAMKDDGDGGLTYCDASMEVPKVWNVYVREDLNDGQMEIHEDEDFESKNDALARADELVKQYDNAPFEEY